MIKKCGLCREKKPFSEFNKNKTLKFGLQHYCRSCQKISMKSWYLKNTAKAREQARLYGKTEKGKVAKKTYYERNYEKILARNRAKAKIPKTEEVKIKERAARKKWFEKPQNKIACTLRNKIHEALKIHLTIDLLGCSLEEFKKHLESNFKPGMNWENYGQRGWHVDHKIPCAKFDLTNPKEQKVCFHYSNLQPLWWQENLSKGSKVL